MAQSKVKLNQFIQDGATDGQVITWDNGLGVYKPVTPVTGVTDHGALTGLTDDDHTQYPLLVGRVGGQTLIGGTGAGDDLILSSTSNATRGDIILNPNGGQVYIGGGTAASSLRFYEPSGSGTNYVEFVSGALAGNVSFILPNVDAAGVLHSDGGSLLSFSKVAVSDLANGTAGQLITWATGGAPAVVTTGTSGQVLTSNGTGNAPTFQTTAAAGIYGGSGTIPGNVAATLQTAGSFKFEYFGGQDGFVFDDTTGAIYMKDKTAEYGVQMTATGVRMFSDGGAGQILMETTGGVSINQSTIITTNGATIDANAALDVASVTKLLYVPRMTTTERNAIATPNDGGVLYNLTTDALTVRANGAWVELGVGGGGGAVATDAIWDAKGDLAVGTGADTAAKLTVGTNGQGIFADSAASTGLRWGPKIISPAQITADQDDYNPTGWADANIVRLDFDTEIRAITSFAATFDGDIKTLINISDNTAYIPAEHPDGTAANRVDGPSAYLLYGKQSVDIRYDGTSSRWRITTQSEWPIGKKAMVYDLSAGSITLADSRDYNWLATGTGAAFTGVAASANTGSRMRCSTGTTSTGSGYFHPSKTSTHFFRTSEALSKHTAMLSIDVLSDATDNFSVYSSIDSTPNGSGENNNSVGFRYTHGLNAGNWTAYSKSNAGVVTQVDTGIAVAADTMYVLDIVYNKDRTEALFYINGVYKARINTNMPSATVAMGTRISIQKAIGTAARTVDIHSTSSYAIWK